MAAATQNKRLVAIDCLLSRRQAATRFWVIDIDRHVHIDAAERVNNSLEAIEIDFRIMRDWHAREFRNRFHRKRRAAKRIRGIDFIDAVTVNIDQRIALDGNERHLLLLGVDARKHHRVTAICIAEFAARIAIFRLVGTHEKHVERLGKGLVDKRAARFVVNAKIQLAVENSHIRKRRTAAHKQHRDQRAHNSANDFPALLPCSNARVFRLRRVARKRRGTLARTRVAVRGARIGTGG